MKQTNETSKITPAPRESRATASGDRSITKGERLPDQDNETRIEAHDLFNHFTEGIIKQNKSFVR